VRSTRFARSARLLVWGVVLLVVGVVVWDAARRANARDAILAPSFGGQPGAPWLVIGGFLAVLGLGLLGFGLFRLTRAVDPDASAGADDLAERETGSVDETTARFATDEGAVVDAPREPTEG
jgi:heme/copper-type cytochrome/quinol oxidase subunit 2